ncbi:DDT domain-containing protein DDR4-like isoform X3 [Aristolochia californica]|uniref:DDT domain-containing protein DDR4-like isoform X3 n=1 Tax=Aristolochia californica TaxID=171875 RepID=UPI0035D7F1A8
MVIMSDEPSTVVQPNGSPPDKQNAQPESAATVPSSRKVRLPRACTSRSAARLYHAAVALGTANSKDKDRDKAKDDQPQKQCSKIITPLVHSPPPTQVPRWNLRSMWELASLLNFLHVFRPLLNIGIEFSAEELETALITPNNTLDDIHIPLLKAIPPVTRMALGRATWVTVLCRKLRDWWHWVAEGDIPVVAAHGLEVETYKNLDPGIRVQILKALCDIRVEQEDIRSYIDNSLKHGVQLSTFRKERIGGDSQGISFWYEDDPVVGQRLYREIRKVDVKKGKGKGVPSTPIVSIQWETVASNLDEFQEASEKLVSSKNRTEAALGKRLKSDIIPEVDKIHKVSITRKERLLKKQHRQALLLDSYSNPDGIATGRSLRDRKPVTYTFDDYDRSINEAIKITKKRQTSPEAIIKREAISKLEASSNGSRWNGLPQGFQHVSNGTPSPKSIDHDETDEEHKTGLLERMQRPQRYSEKEFIDAVSDHEAEFDSDDDIVGEAVYDDEYLRSRKQRKVSSSSEGDEEYRWEEENAEDEEEEEDSLSVSEDEEEQQSSRKVPTRSRRGAKTRSVDELQSGLRRSKRATRTRIDYRQYEVSDSETDSARHKIATVSERNSDASNNVEYTRESQASEEDEADQEIKVDQSASDYVESIHKEENQPHEKVSSPPDQGAEVVRKRRFLDLNELAPGTGFEDGSTTVMKDEDVS